MHEQVPLVEEEVVFDGAEVPEEVLFLQHHGEQPLAGIAMGLGGEGSRGRVGVPGVSLCCFRRVRTVPPSCDVIKTR